MVAECQIPATFPVDVLQALFQNIWHWTIERKRSVEQVLQEIDVRLQADSLLNKERIYFRAVVFRTAKRIYFQGLGLVRQSQTPIFFLGRFDDQERLIAITENRFNRCCLSAAGNTADECVLFQVVLCQAKRMRALDGSFSFLFYPAHYDMPDHN